MNFDNCQFFENRNRRILIKIMHGNYVTLYNCNLKHNKLPLISSLSRSYIEINYVSNATIKHCYFYHNNQVILSTVNTTAVIENTTFSSIEPALMEPTIYSRNTNLLLNGPVIFHKNLNKYGSIIKLSDGIITVHGYIQFSLNSAFSMIAFYCKNVSHCFMMKVLENTTINITNNTLFMYFSGYVSSISVLYTDVYIQCFFQYYSSSTSSLDNYIYDGNVSIIFKFS